MADPLELPFDQYQRYELVRALLASVRGEGETFHVLDVGGRTALLRLFLPDDRIELVDVDPSEVPGLILGSGAQLPFRDNSFDVVAAFDTLEHVPPDLREAFVAECGRVARRYVMLAGPYHSERVAEAEEALLEFLSVQLSWEHRYLAEHRDNGLPDAVATRAGLESSGARVESFGHGALDRWQVLMSLELYIEHQSLLREIAPRIYRLYNEHLFATDHGPEVYRHAIVGAFDGAEMPTLEHALQPVGSAPSEVVDTLGQVGREILRYDALRDTYEPEMARLHGVVADVQNDLVEHKRTIEALREELARERAATQEMAAEKDEHIGGLTADLAGHKDTVAELRRLHETEASEIEARGEVIDQINKQLTAQNDQLIERDKRLHDAHHRLTSALERVAEGEAIESRLREGLANALSETDAPARRRELLEEHELTVEEALELLIDARDRRLRERDEAREQLAAIASELLASHEKNALFRSQAKRRWARLGRVFGLQNFDERLFQ